MILEMARVRILGPREARDTVLAALQDLELLHLAPAPTLAPLRSTPPGPERGEVQAALEAVEGALGLLPIERGPSPPAAEELEGAHAGAIEVRTQAAALVERARALVEEEELLSRYRDIMAAFSPLAGQAGPGRGVIHLLLRAGQERAIPRLREALARLEGDHFELLSRPLPTGEIAIALLLPPEAEARVEALLAGGEPATPFRRLPVPEAYGGGSLASAMPAMRARLAAIPGEQAQVREALAALGRRWRPWLDQARRRLHDRLAALGALERVAESPGAFAIEGWVPARSLPLLEARLTQAAHAPLSVERLGREQWTGELPPVVLKNPRLFRPFEAVTRMLPLPRYGSIDPTPFVAIFLPMFYGVILGDVGYGLLLGLASLGLAFRARRGSNRRAISRIGGAFSLFSIAFGLVYGEFFGDLGQRLLGMEPWLISREEAVIPFLIFAVALGLGHVLLGLVLGAITHARDDRRAAAAKGLQAVLLVLLALALLAAFEVLPREALQPVLVAALVAFPLLVVAEGLLAPLELLSTFSRVLSYARIMAVGTASVMMAVVANRMVGAIGSIAVGVVFAVIFHLVNLVIGIFSPTIHVLRLHYVEFFGRFYQPGGRAYAPFGHWQAPDGSPPT